MGVLTNMHWKNDYIIFGRNLISSLNEDQHSQLKHQTIGGQE